MNTNNETVNFGDIEFYNNGTLIFRVYNTLDGVALRPENSKPLQVGGIGMNTYALGNWTGVIPVMTQAEAEAKTDWLMNQLVIITEQGGEVNES